MSKTKNKIAQLKAQWGKLKSDYFNFDLIEEYFELKTHTETADLINDRIANDLDLPDFFKYVDRTHSAVGQQYLFYKLRHLNNSEADLKELELEVQFFNTHEKERLAAQQILGKLTKSEDYYFPFLIFGSLPSPISFLWFIRLLQLIIFAGILGLLISPFFSILLILVFGVNIFLHYWHKNRIGHFASIFSRLLRLSKTATQLLPFTNQNDAEKARLAKQIKTIDKITNSVFLLKTDELQNNEITAAVWYLIELVKIASLSEIITFHSVVDEIEASRKEIEGLFCFIGATDMAISIGSLRAGLPFYCQPKFISNQKAIKVEGLYHPLIADCVENDLELNNKSLLLTGSNMSGKTTFVRAINLNTIAAQTLNTSFSKSSQTPFFALATSIRIADDITEDKSYYMEEVLTIGNLIECSKETKTQYLFTIDEVFKGTNTIERVAAAKAILEYLNQAQHLILVSTHDIELTTMLQKGFDLYYFQESVENETLSFDYKLKKGALEKKNAIKILEIAGYPPEVLEEAKRLTIHFEKEKTGQ